MRRAGGDESPRFLGCGLGRWLRFAMTRLVIGCLSACGGVEPRPATETKPPAPPVGLVAYREPGAVIVESLDGSRKPPVPGRGGRESTGGRSLCQSLRQENGSLSLLTVRCSVLELASQAVERVPVALEAQEQIDGAVGLVAMSKRLLFTGGRVRSCEMARTTDSRIYTVSRDGAEFQSAGRRDTPYRCTCERESHIDSRSDMVT